MKQLLIIFLLSFCITSCGKKRTIIISAKNAATGESYSGLKYYVLSSVTRNGEEKYKTEASGTLDANGMAAVELKVRSSRTYSVQVDQPESTCYNKKITMYFDSPSDENGHFNFEFAECSYLKQNIVNVNCEGSSDIFNIRDRFTYSEWSGWSYDIMGCFSNTGGDYFPVPAGKRYFNWKVTRLSGTIEHTDSIDLAPGEYGELNINY